jgi:hypothetical protein
VAHALCPGGGVAACSGACRSVGRFEEALVPSAEQCCVRRAGVSRRV